MSHTTKESLGTRIMLGCGLALFGVGMSVYLMIGGLHMTYQALKGDI